MKLVAAALVAAVPLTAKADGLTIADVRSLSESASAEATLYLVKSEKKKRDRDDLDDRRSSRKGKALQENHKINPTYGSRRTLRRGGNARGLFFGGSFFRTGLFFQD